MAGNEGEERTEQPTAKRLREARERGQVPRSRELGVIAAIVSPMFVSGVSFSSKAMMPDFTRLNPLSGFKRLYSGQALGEIAKAVIRVALVGAIGWTVLRSRMPAIVGLLDEPTREAIPHGASIAIGMLFALTFGMLGIAAIDVPYQIWQHRRQLKMTREEVRQEMKESDGSPEVKARIRRAQHALANRRMLEAVPKADAVIVNTCAVTAEAERQARQAIRKARRENPSARIIPVIAERQVSCAMSPR